MIRSSTQANNLIPGAAPLRGEMAETEVFRLHEVLHEAERGLLNLKAIPVA